MKRTLVSLAAASLCDRAKEPIDLVGAISPSPQRQSFVALVPPDDNAWWAEQLRAPVGLEPGDTPLFRGELGTLDCGYTFKPSRPPVVEWPRRTGKASWLNAGATIEPGLIGFDRGSPDGDMTVYGKWEDGKLQIVENVKTGPGTPFFKVDDSYWRSISPHHGRETMRISEDGQLTAKAQAPYFWHPSGSMGEDAVCEIVQTDNSRQTWQHDETGRITTTGAEDPHPGPRWALVGFPGEALMWEHHCSDGGLTATEAGASCPWCGATEFGSLRAILDKAATDAMQDVLDRAEVERINLTGARYRESVRLSPMGSEPWDFAAGECS